MQASRCFNLKILLRLFRVTSFALLVTLLSLTAHGFELERNEYETIKAISLKILREYPPDQYFYIGVGRSPTPIISFLEHLAPGSAGFLPASKAQWFETVGRTNEEKELLKTHFNRFLPNPEVLGNRKILLLDHVQTGESLAAVRDLIRKYAQNDQVKAVALHCPHCRSAVPAQVLIRKGLEQVTYDDERQLVRFAGQRYDQYSPYGSAFLLEPESLRRIPESTKYVDLSTAMGDVISRDRKLAGDLQNYRNPRPAQKRMVQCLLDKLLLLVNH